MKITTVKQYLKTVPKSFRPALAKLRQTIKKSLPEAEEVISYGMPAYKFHGVVVWFAASKNHYAIYVRPRFKIPFKEELKSFETTKSAIHFSYNKPLPDKLVKKIVNFIAKENLKNSKL